MRQFEINIKEFDIDNENFNAKGVKNFNITALVDDSIGDAALSTVLEIKWADIKNYFLVGRKDIPFRELRSDYETK